MRRAVANLTRVLDSAFPRDSTVTTSHLRRFAKANQLPNSLKRKESPSREASDASSPQQTIYVLIPPPLPDISTIQTLLSPYAPGDPAVGQAPTSINIQSTRILLQPPTSLERAENFSKEFWPIIYNPAAHPAAHSPPPATLARMKQALEPEAGKYLALAIRIAEEAKELGRGRPVGVVAVEPTLAKVEDESYSDGNELRGVIAVAGDARYCGKPSQNFDSSISPSNTFDSDQEGGPEKHALMRLIALIANKRLTETSQAHPLSTGSTTAYQNQIPPLSPLESLFLHPPPPPTSQQESKDTEPGPLPGLLSSDNEISVDTNANSSTGPYLCNSLDIYITHDPCACCAMGMVLSRFRAVVFIRDEARTGLGGLASTGPGPSESSGPAAGYGLNWRRELNWRVLGFEFAVEGNGEKKEGEYREEKFNA